MMKTGKPALQGAKASGSSVESSLAYPHSSLVVSPGPQSSQAKSKSNRFKITASILKMSSSTAPPRPPEAFNGLPNGLLPLEPDESPSDKSGQRRNFPKDITDFGLFQKRHRNEPTSAAEETSRKMYSLSEEAGESGGSDAEERDKEGTAGGEEETKLLGGEMAEEAAVTAADIEVSNTKYGSEEDEEKWSEMKTVAPSWTRQPRDVWQEHYNRPRYDGLEWDWQSMWALSEERWFGV